MKYLIIFIIGCLLIKIFRLKKENLIYRNNYYTLLNVLMMFDPTLKSYLEKEKK